MSTKILAITHKNFSHLYKEVIDLLNLPLDLDIIEVNFGELHKLGDDLFSKYDLVITSGAHLEMINKQFYELTYLVPFYPIHFTESDLIKSMVQAKKYGNKILLMYLSEVDYELDKYAKILDIELKEVHYQNLEEAKQLMLENYRKGFSVVIGTSSICELATENGIKNVLVYSKDSLKLEIIKAYHLAATKNKMVNYSKAKDAILLHAGRPMFILDENYRILDTNTAGIQYLRKNNKNELLGEDITNLVNFQFDKKSAEPQIIQQDKEQIVVEPIVNGATGKTFLITIKNADIIKNKQETVAKSKYKFTNIIHSSPNMKKIILKAKQYAHTDAPLLITGESGTGKELIAHSVHQFSDRKAHPFLPVNCSAIPENILESELFGYEEGAFTGAKKGGKPGYFEMAQNGTIFLDEIGEIPLEIQTKLLRVLQEKEVIRLGGKKVIPLNVRVITATNKSLVDLIKEGKFREDLYYRINVLQIHVPPIRQRKEDILPILEHLLIKYGLDSRQANYLVTVMKDFLVAYNWPGNVRELENFAQRFCALNSVANTTYDLLKLFKEVFDEFRNNNAFFEIEEDKIEEKPNVKNIHEAEMFKIVSALIEANGNRNKAAYKLGVSRTTLWRKMKQYNIDL